MVELETRSAPDSSRRAAPGDVTQVLIVDDDDAMRGTLRRVLRARQMHVEEARDGEDAARMLSQRPFDVVLTDVRMPRMTGEQLVQHVVAEGYDCSVVVMTAYADIPTAVSCVRAGAFAFLTKPFASNEALAIEVRNAARFKRLGERATALEAQVQAARGPQIVGESPGMRNLLRALAGFAPTQVSVLISGETGTGKELVVRALHQGSTRARNPLVTVNCASLPEDLVESALFGHVRGAFSGNTPARSGFFEAAHGGTLFLDEIGELPLGTQARLLRVLETGEVRRVGADDSRAVDVRVLATSNADLRAMCARGEFRADLFYRLNVASLRVPPLRERGDDVLLLAAHILREASAREGKPAPGFAPDAIEALLRYSWPGNVRELQHALHHALIVENDGKLTAACLPQEVRHGSAMAPTTTSVFDADLMSAPYQDAKRMLLERFAAAYLQRAVHLSGGNMSEAARRAGLDRSNFRKLFLRRTDAGGSEDDAPESEPSD